MRLRVDHHSRFRRRDGVGAALRLSDAAIDPQRFGAQFVDKVANPFNILRFAGEEREE